MPLLLFLTLMFLPDGKILMADDRMIRVVGGGQVAVKDYDDLAVSQDGKTLAVTWGAEEVAVYSLPSGKLSWKARTERPGKQGGYALELSPDGRWLLSRGGTDPFVRLWDGGRVVLKLPAETRLAWTSDNRLARVDGATTFLSSGPAFSDAHGLVQDSPVLDLSRRDGQLVTLSSTLREGDAPEVRAWIWDLASGKLAQTVALEAPASHLEISQDGTRLLAWDDPSMKYQLWDLSAKRLVASGMGRPSFAGPTVVVNQPRSVRAVRASDGVETARVMWDGPRVVSPDGRVMVTHGLGGGSVTVWDLASGQKLGTLPAGKAIAFSADGSVLAVGDADKVKLYDARTLTPR